MKWLNVLPEGERKVVKADGHSLLLIHEAGEVYAIASAARTCGCHSRAAKLKDIPSPALGTTAPSTCGRAT